MDVHGARRLNRLIWLVVGGLSCAGDPVGPLAAVRYDVLFSSTEDGTEPSLFRAGFDAALPEAVAGGTSGRFPVASSDGGTIVFNRLDETGDYRLMILRPEMIEPGAVGGASGMSPLQPALSPDGSRLVFSSTHEDSYGDVYVATLSGTSITDVRRLTTGGGPDLTARWSADGEQIAFTSYRTGYPSIWTMTADGLAQAQVTFAGMEFGDYFPSWSPDGSSLVFQRIGSTESRIGIVPTSGGTVTFFDLPGRNYSPAWSPDGGHIAVASDHDDITILSAQGAIVTRIDQPGIDRSPSWIRRDAPWLRAAPRRRASANRKVL